MYDFGRSSDLNHYLQTFPAPPNLPAGEEYGASGNWCFFADFPCPPLAEGLGEAFYSYGYSLGFSPNSLFIAHSEANGMRDTKFSRCKGRDFYAN